MRTRFSTLQFSLTGFNWAQEKSKGSHDTAHILSYLQVEEIIKIGPRGFIVKSLLLWNVSYITTPGHAVLTSANKLEDPYIASIQFRTHIHTHVPVQAHTCVWLYLLCILSNFKQTQILNCIFKDKFRVTNQIYQGQYDLFLRINYVYSNRKQNGSHWPDFSFFLRTKNRLMQTDFYSEISIWSHFLFKS